MRPILGRRVHLQSRARKSDWKTAWLPRLNALARDEQRDTQQRMQTLRELASLPRLCRNRNRVDDLISHRNGENVSFECHPRRTPFHNAARKLKPWHLGLRKMAPRKQTSLEEGEEGRRKNLLDILLLEQFF